MTERSEAVASLVRCRWCEGLGLVERVGGEGADGVMVTCGWCGGVGSEWAPTGYSNPRARVSNVRGAHVPNLRELEDLAQVMACDRYQAGSWPGEE